MTDRLRRRRTETQRIRFREGEAGYNVHLEGKVESTSRLQTTSTKLQRIAEQAKRYPEMTFTTLMHLVTPDFLYKAESEVKRNKAPGLSGITAAEYRKKLIENIKDLWNRLKKKIYKAPPLKRVWIEKDDKRLRPIALTEYEDKIAQRAIVMLLEPIYENDFYDFSYGFRKGRNPHQALHHLREECMKNNISWIVDADIKGYFDSINHEKLKSVIKKRVNDGSVIRLIGKWLKAGIFEDESLKYPDRGAPQGGVVSPLLSNIYLHYVLDDWYVKEVKPRLKGKSFLIRFADDFTIGCEYEEDARRIMAVLHKRFAKYDLTIHPEKTVIVKYKRPPWNGKSAKENGTFNYLGFTHYWSKSRRGSWVIKRKTENKRQIRAKKRIWRWCKENRHKPLAEQYKTIRSKLIGHYNYYGIRCNSKSINCIFEHLKLSWKYWLERRSQRNQLTWKKLKAKLTKAGFILPAPRIVHSI